MSYEAFDWEQETANYWEDMATARENELHNARREWFFLDNPEGDIHAGYEYLD